MKKASVLVAGIGNIFQGDDAFGVAVVQKLAAQATLHHLPLRKFVRLPEYMRVMDVGIRAIDLGFALLYEYPLVILVDATQRGGAPGTLYTIEIRPEDIPDQAHEPAIVNGHGLNPVGVLALAKSMGAPLRKILLVGCEPLVLDHDESGYIGLSAPVAAAVDAAVEMVLQLAAEYAEKEEVLAHESV